MSENVASIRELRTNFPRVKQKVEEHGEVVITDYGEPAYVLKRLLPKSKPTQPMPDYYKRLLRRQPRPMSKEETEAFWEEDRG